MGMPASPNVGTEFGAGHVIIEDRPACPGCYEAHMAAFRAAECPRPGRGSLACSLALVGLLIWPLGYLAAGIGWKAWGHALRCSRCPVGPAQLGAILGAAEASWCTTIGALILTRHV